MSDHDDVTTEVSREDRSEVRLPPPADPLGDARREFAERLVEEARATAVNLVGRGGRLSDVTKRVLETGLDVELTEHLGYGKHAVEGRDGDNARNWTRAKTVLTDVGPSSSDRRTVEYDKPRGTHRALDDRRY